MVEVVRKIEVILMMMMMMTTADDDDDDDYDICYNFSHQHSRVPFTNETVPAQEQWLYKLNFAHLYFYTFI